VLEGSGLGMMGWRLRRGLGESAWRRRGATWQTESLVCIYYGLEVCKLDLNQISEYIYDLS